MISENVGDILIFRVGNLNHWFRTLLEDDHEQE